MPIGRGAFIACPGRNAMGPPSTQSEGENKPQEGTSARSASAGGGVRRRRKSSGIDFVEDGDRPGGDGTDDLSAGNANQEVTNSTNVPDGNGARSSPDSEEHKELTLVGESCGNTKTGGDAADIVDISVEAESAAVEERSEGRRGEQDEDQSIASTFETRGDPGGRTANGLADNRFTQPVEMGNDSPLGKLLLDMTRTAEALASTSKKLPGRSMRQAQCVTAVVVLDSPLFSEATPTVASGITTASNTNEITEEISDEGQAILNRDADLYSKDRPKAPPSDELGTDDERDEDSAKSGGSLQTRGRNVPAVMQPEHPAGLGDPAVALAAFLEWIRIGAAGCQGMREILLVCGSSNAGGRVGPADAMEAGQSHGGGGTYSGQRRANSRLEAERGYNTVDISSTDDTNDDGDGIIKRSVFGSDEQETVLRNRSETREGPIERPTIRQIVLDGGSTLSTRNVPAPIPVFRRPSGQDEEDLPNPAKHSTTEEIPSLHNASSTYDKRNMGSSSSVKLCYYLSRPSEVLLLIQSACKDDEGPRVVASFPAFTPPYLRPFAGCDTSQLSELGSKQTVEPGRTAGPMTLQKKGQVRPPRVKVGPVIGRVSSTSAVLLVEADAICPQQLARVGVLLLDTLSGQRFLMRGGVPSGDGDGGPRVFEFEGLTPGRHYVVRIVSVRQRDQVSDQVSPDVYTKPAGYETA